jgi:hypothetical protein
MANDLEPYENITRVFWIKIELKDNRGKDRQDLGDIRDVISGAKSTINDLLDIIDFIVPYLQQMGISVGWFWQLTIWMKRSSKIKEKIAQCQNSVKTIVIFSRSLLHVLGKFLAKFHKQILLQYYQEIRIIKP